MKFKTGNQGLTGSVLAPAVNATFYDNFIPSLKDSEYLIQVKQDLEVDQVQTGKDGGNTAITNPPQPPMEQKFIVRGPRFSIDPADVHRVFPANNVSGIFDTFLPMVVFNRRSIPWERGLELSASQYGQQNPDTYPWMALMVFSPDELVMPQPPGGTPAGKKNPTMSASFAIQNVVMPSSELTIPGPPTGILGPAITLEDNEDPTTTFCDVIDLPVQTFTDLVPSLDDMRFLCHVRQTQTDHKEPLNMSDDGWFSNIISNRFSILPPTESTDTPQKNIVHLVSLEGFEPYLNPPPTGSSAPPLSEFEKVRLISLYSWTFECQAEPKQNFKELMLHLISPESEQGTLLTLRKPLTPGASEQATASQQKIIDKLLSGYVPLNYHTRSGEQTFAWYRGPFSPVVTPPFVDTLNLDAPGDVAAPVNASEAMIYEPASGLFDHSYSVAFQTGRSLALASKVFSLNLLQWRRDVHTTVDRIHDYLNGSHWYGILNPSLAQGEMPQIPEPAALAGLTSGNIMGRAVKNFLASEQFQSLVRRMNEKNRPAIRATQLSGSSKRQAATPQRLKALMEDTSVQSYIRHASGLETLGTINNPVSLNDTSIFLQQPGATEAVATGAQLVVTSADGKLKTVVEVAADISKTDLQVQILPSTNASSLPAGSILQLADNQLMPAQVIQWLAQAALGYNVPFNNIVPDAQMLQQESIRFFYIDQNWINALLDGALSVGIQSSRDRMLQQMCRAAIHQAVVRILPRVRDAVRNKVSGPLENSQGGSPAGFLLRSVAVSAWKGLEVRAWSDIDPVNPMKPLRLDRVAPDILVVIFPDTPVRVEINEPSEGLVFGHEDDGIELRYIPGVTGASSSNTGDVILDPVHQQPIWISTDDINKIKRSPSTSQPPVLTITGRNSLVSLLQQALPPGTTALSPASLAVEMVRVPEQLLLEPLIKSISP